MFPEWHYAVPESAYFKVPETLKNISYVPDFQVRLCFALAGNPTIYMCRSDETLQAVGPFYLVYMPGEVTWTPRSNLEKDMQLSKPLLC